MQSTLLASDLAGEVWAGRCPLCKINLILLTSAAPGCLSPSNPKRLGKPFSPEGTVDAVVSKGPVVSGCDLSGQQPACSGAFTRWHQQLSSSPAAVGQAFRLKPLPAKSNAHLQSQRDGWETWPPEAFAQTCSEGWLLLLNRRFQVLPVFSPGVDNSCFFSTQKIGTWLNLTESLSLSTW